MDDRIRKSAAAVLPFSLTPGQRTAIKEIVEDLQRPAPMHRLLQGDVGAGKTIVALLAAVVAMENGLQVAMLAPTEILAKQHYATLARLLASIAVPRGPADGRHARAPSVTPSWRTSSAARRTWWWARTRWCRSR